MKTHPLRELILPSDNDGAVIRRHGRLSPKILPAKACQRFDLRSIAQRMALTPTTLVVGGHLKATKYAPEGQGIQ